MHITSESWLCTNTAQCSPTLIIIIIIIIILLLFWHAPLPQCSNPHPKTWNPLTPLQTTATQIQSSLIFSCCKAWYDTFTFFSKGDEMIQQCLQCFQKISFEKLFSVLVHILISLDSRFLVGVWLQSPWRYSSDMTSASITRFHPYHGKYISYLMKTWVK